MFYNYLKIAFRNLLKHKGYSFINISGLAIGIACCLLIFLYVKDELTYDRFHSNDGRIFRITSLINLGGTENNLGATSYAEGPAYLEGVPEYELLARVNGDAGIIKVGDSFVQQTGMLYAETSLFKIFDFKVLHGALDGALDGLNNIVLTKKMAIKYFGKTDVIGEELTMNVENELENFIVTAVIGDHPSNSSFNFEIVLNWKKGEAASNPVRLTSWGSIGINTFVLLREGASPDAAIEKMTQIRASKNPGEQGDFAREIVNGLQPMADIHLNQSIRGGDALGISGDRVYSYILSGIALVILILACINFTNLSVARSLPRAKEIGVRKVLGAHQRQLAFQFLNEALLMSMIAFVVGLILAEISLPVFGTLLEKTFYSGVTDDMVLIFSCFGLVLLTAFLSGFYPSFIVSRFNTVVSLKGKVKLNGKSNVSKGLVVLQFTIAAVLIVGTVAMNRQISHLVNMDLGYDDENLIRIDADDSGIENLAQLFKDRLAQNPNIEMASGADNYGSATFFTYKEKDYVSAYNDIDENFIEMMGIELLKGRLLRKNEDIHQTEADTFTNVLVNQAFVKELALEDPIYTTFEGNRIVGIVKDFHFQSARGTVTPLMFISENGQGRGQFSSIFVKYKPEYLPQIQTVLEDVWREYVPYRPFESAFVAESNAARYEDEARWKKIITYSSGLAISISILGLFGLAHLATQQRIKEIGIRKVLGASLSQIVVLLNSNFARLVLVSIILSTPVAFFLLERWLENFANKIDLTVMLFAIPGLITFGIAFLTVTFQSLKSASSNPVDSLRYE